MVPEIRKVLQFLLVMIYNSTMIILSADIISMTGEYDASQIPVVAMLLCGCLYVLSLFKGVL